MNRAEYMYEGGLPHVGWVRYTYKCITNAIRISRVQNVRFATHTDLNEWWIFANICWKKKKDFTDAVSFAFIIGHHNNIVPSNVTEGSRLQW